MASFRTLGVAVFGVLSLVLGACGGGGGGGGSAGGTTGGVQTATGVFKDANVSGLSYRSGSRSGLTGAEGQFTYEVGQPVTFMIGGVTLGSAPGQSVVTPLDLVPSGSSGAAPVQNMVRFLMMLDSDGVPTNGISISPAVQSVATNWQQMDFSAGDFDAQVAPIVATASSADATARTLPPATQAQSHIESTLLCLRSGAYRGTYAGTDTGPFAVIVDAASGVVSGFAFSNDADDLESLSGDAAVSFDQNAAFVTGGVSSGASFSGKISGADQIAGTWQNTPFGESGTFSGTRVGGLANALYRFTGEFGGGASGLFTFDIAADDTISGIAYTITSLTQPGVPVDQAIALSGSLSGNTLSAKTADNGTTITGTLDKSSGALSGTWSDTAGNSGTFAGSGCKLN